MNQSRLEATLNRHVFNQEKITLLKKIVENPDRFTGVFRSTSPELKLLQNILQSREIRFGDALEEVFSELIAEMGFINLPKDLLPQDEEEMSCDHYFKSADGQKFFLIEQKIRDDHDSTKKRGQFENFSRKIAFLKADLLGSSLTGAMYFIDPSLVKNRKYYQTRLSELEAELNVPVYLFYDGALFEFLEGGTSTWDNLVDGLKQWRSRIPGQINLNFDSSPEETVQEIKSLSPRDWYKIISNNALWESGVLNALFPEGNSLQLLSQTFIERGSEQFRAGKSSRTLKELAFLIQQKLYENYGNKYPPPDLPTRDQPRFT